MRQVNLINAHKRYRIKKNQLVNGALSILKREKASSGDLNIILSDNLYLAKLNKKFRKKQNTTDVLSFPYNEPDFLGEIYISLEKVKEQAKEFSTPFYSELWFLIIHGILHLLGYTHKSPEKESIMKKKELLYKGLI